MKGCGPVFDLQLSHLLPSWPTASEFSSERCCFLKMKREREKKKKNQQPQTFKSKLLQKENLLQAKKHVPSFN